MLASFKKTFGSLKYRIVILLCLSLMVVFEMGGCSSGDQGENSSLPPNNLTANPDGDITDLKLTNRNPDCAAYVGTYTSNVSDVQESSSYTGSFTISSTDDACLFVSNNIPNHNVGEDISTGGNFASVVAPNVLDYELNIPRNPTRTDTATYIRKRGGYITLNGIMLNGVDLDMDSAFCYDSGTSSISLAGCGLTAEWYLVPKNNPANVALDQYEAHPFQGRYHYHGNNTSLSNTGPDRSPNSSIVDPSGSPVIGFASDGFPIYGLYFYDAQSLVVRKARSSWTTYTDERAPPEGSSNTAPPIATYERGLFVEDWYYAEGSGDLDECNGMVDAYGNYGYYTTETYPFGPICVFGAADSSFEKLQSLYDDGGVN